ncbi:unnamed protein product, partial [marine sediment metagenome]
NSYYMNFYFNIITGLNDFTCNYFFHIDYIKTKFVENQWDGDAFAKDDDGGNSSVVVNFYTQDDIDIPNLCPDINLIMNNGGLMEQNITFYLDYYYRSYFRDDANFIFEQISTLQDSQQQRLSSEYGNQATDAGSGGDNGYVSVHQTTDAQSDLGSVEDFYELEPQINCDGNNTGNGYDDRWTTVVEGIGSNEMTFSSGNYDNINNFFQTEHDTMTASTVNTYYYHYPGNPGQSFYGDSGDPDGWT